MRDILFRGKRIDGGKWIEGSLWNNYGEVKILSVLSAIGYEVIPETVGQYTGLTDKNGKWIFEGDIVKGAWDTVFQVVYDECYLGFQAKDENGFYNPIDYYGLDRIEVIGNIHDNPELLKGEKDNG